MQSDVKIFTKMKTFVRAVWISAWILQPFLSSDINECTNGTHNCHAAATCNNTEGSFTCACNPGWNGDGVNCTGM